MQRGPLKGLSCVMGNYHAQFLGGKGVERPLLYPELFSEITTYYMWAYLIIKTNPKLKS